MWLSKTKTIEDFCALATEVNDKVFNYSLATDCFCTKQVSGDYRFNQEVMDFIREAVKEKIERGFSYE